MSPFVEQGLESLGRFKVVVDPHLAAREAGLSVPRRACSAFDEPDCVAVDGEFGHDGIPHSLRGVVTTEQLRCRWFGQRRWPVELRLVEHRYGLEATDAGRDNALVTGLVVDDTLGRGHRCVDPQCLLTLGDLASAPTFCTDSGPGLVGGGEAVRFNTAVDELAGDEEPV